MARPGTARERLREVAGPLTGEIREERRPGSFLPEGPARLNVPHGKGPDWPGPADPPEDVGPRALPYGEGLRLEREFGVDIPVDRIQRMMDRLDEKAVERLRGMAGRAASVPPRESWELPFLHRPDAAREGAPRAPRRRLTGASTGEPAHGRPRRCGARTGVPAGRRRSGCSLYVPATDRPVEAPGGAPTGPARDP